MWQNATDFLRNLRLIQNKKTYLAKKSLFFWIEDGTFFEKVKGKGFSKPYETTAADLIGNAERVENESDSDGENDSEVISRLLLPPPEEEEEDDYEEDEGESQDFELPRIDLNTVLYFFFPHARPTFENSSLFDTMYLELVPNHEMKRKNFNKISIMTF